VIVLIDDRVPTRTSMQQKSPALPHHCDARVAQMVGQRRLAIVVCAVCNSGGWFQKTTRLQFACLTHPTFWGSIYARTARMVGQRWLAIVVCAFCNSGG